MLSLSRLADVKSTTNGRATPYAVTMPLVGNAFFRTSDSMSPTLPASRCHSLGGSESVSPARVVYARAYATRRQSGCRRDVPDAVALDRLGALTREYEPVRHRVVLDTTRVLDDE